MENFAEKRIKKELKSDELRSGEIKLEVIDDNFLDLRAEVRGPRDSPYEGGHFKLEIKIPNEYPFVPPNVRFTTMIWHPNVSSVTGMICLDALKIQWAAGFTLRTVLLTVQALLFSAEPDYPQESVVATQYKQNYEIYDATARYWTLIYANGPHVIPEFNDMVCRMVYWGLEARVAIVLLSICNWVFDDAVECLFNPNA